MRSSKGKEKVFHLNGRASIARSAGTDTILALLAAAKGIVQWDQYVKGLPSAWWDQWWVFAILSAGLLLMAGSEWQRYFFIKLKVASDGIWHSRLGKTRHFAWESIERIGQLPPRKNRKPEYGLFLRENAIAVEKDALRHFSLSPFVEAWSTSDLRKEILRQKPSLPVE